MRYSITFVEDDYRMLGEHLHQPNFEEQGAYLLCSLSFTGSESRLLVREVIPARQEEVISASSSHMEIAPQSFMRAMKRADARHLSFVLFIPTHTVRPAILRRTMSQSPASFGRRTRVSAGRPFTRAWCAPESMSPRRESGTRTGRPLLLRSSASSEAGFDSFIAYVRRT